MMEKKIYTKKKEKVIDFLIGFFFVLIFIGITNFISGAINMLLWLPTAMLPKDLGRIISMVIYVIVWILSIVFILHFSRKRKYIALGLLFFIAVASLVLLGTCLFLGDSIIARGTR